MSIFANTGTPIYPSNWRDWGRHVFLSLSKGDGDGLILVAAGARLTIEQTGYLDELLEDLLYLQQLYQERDDTEDHLSAMHAQVLAANGSVARLLMQGVWVLWRPGAQDVAIELMCLR